MSNSSHSGGDFHLPATLNPPAEGGPPAGERAGSPARLAEDYDDPQTALSVSEDLEEDLAPCEGDSPQVVELRRTQQLAFAALAEGKSVVCAAARANVDRRTVHRWMRDDEEFRAALETYRVGTMDLVRRQLMAAAPRAAEKVAEATEQGDGKFAMALLKALGAFAGKSAPGGVSMDIDEEIRRRERERRDSADPIENAIAEEFGTFDSCEADHVVDILRLGREAFASRKAELDDATRATVAEVARARAALEARESEADEE
ncbi:MAG TPA: hypothetical protein VG269_29670 [Tepidisphaeraceae bacterium]|jgi:t-SNARE complex subunit (syntaxin)|nr:hypothetical protein [Tepidisphaeraceae bacterium]